MRLHMVMHHLQSTTSLRGHRKRCNCGIQSSTCWCLWTYGTSSDKKMLLCATGSSRMLLGLGGWSKDRMPYCTIVRALPGCSCTPVSCRNANPEHYPTRAGATCICQASLVTEMLYKPHFICTSFRVTIIHVFVSHNLYTRW